MKKTAVPGKDVPVPHEDKNKDGAELMRFDWAIKTVLRDKANFAILEGFLSALLKEDIRVLELLESESNQQQELDKFNRVDLLVKDGQGRRTIIEVQNESEVGFISRLLYGTSKVIVENIRLGEPYTEIKKVISISILYFNPGLGDDYLYYGKTEFRGVHDDQPLMDHHSDQPVKTEKINGRAPAKLRELDIFPEYYLIPVRVFEDVIESDLDEWIYMFKHSRVPDTFKARNIDQAREKLAVLRMSAGALKNYDAYLRAKRHDEEKLAEAREEGMEKGREQGREEGREKGREEERANTEHEHRRAEAERKRAEEAEQAGEAERQRAEDLDRRLRELEEKLANLNP